MTDLRERVEDDRGLIKKIQLAIPGFRGYRQREDLRIADRLLREQLTDRLGFAAKKAEECRNLLAEAKELDTLEKVRKLVNETNSAMNRMRHAEQGYTGVSPDYRIEQSQLNVMYEWDLALLDDVQTVRTTLDIVAGAIPSGDLASVDTGMKAALDALNNFNELFSKRREAIAGLLVEE